MFPLVIREIFKRKIYSKENGFEEIKDWDQKPDPRESIEMEKHWHREKSSEFGFNQVAFLSFETRSEEEIFITFDLHRQSMELIQRFSIGLQ